MKRLLLTVALCFAVVIALSLAMEWAVFRPLRTEPPAVMLVATFAVAFLMQSVALLSFGAASPQERSNAESTARAAEANVAAARSKITAADAGVDLALVSYYFGSKKGAVGTLREGRGNDVDQASLLVALLRASSQRRRGRRSRGCWIRCRYRRSRRAAVDTKKLGEQEIKDAQNNIPAGVSGTPTALAAGAVPGAGVY